MSAVKPLLRDNDYTVDADTGCWVWNGCKDSCGYGQVFRHGRGTTAHQLYFEQLVGPVPPGMQLDHVCENRACVNPNHLDVVTPEENKRRSGVVKLTMDDARLIREMRNMGYPGRSIAALFSISRNTVYDIWSGRYWKEAKNV